VDRRARGDRPVLSRSGVSGIAGVRLIDLQIREDLRGSFLELYRQSWIEAGGGAVQANLSRSSPGVLRGMHFHRRQWDYWCPVAGQAFIALADLRDGSPTRGEIMTLGVSGDEPRGLFIPPGVAHGFYAETEFVMVYLVDAYFDGADEHSVAWDDPDLGITWPTVDPILSDRDKGNPSLREILLAPPRYGHPLG
jgi:dTDP-4-dehydrorhamnose 3,5-epimerase